MRNSAKPNVVGHSFFPLFAVVGLIAGLAGAMMYWPEIGEVETSKVELVEIETVEFAADFSEAEKQMILEILRDNELPDLGVLGRIKLVKTQPPEPVAEANNDGVVRIRADVLAAASYGQLRDIVGHELGHLFDTYFLLDEDRLEYARLRGIKKPGLLDKWYLDPNAHNYAKSELHSVTPAEDLAEVFRQVYFPGSDVGPGLRCRQFRQ